MIRDQEYLDEIVVSLESEFMSAVGRQEKGVRKETITESIIYHYTTLEAAVNILKQRKIRASHFGYLNDKMELLFAKEVVDGIMRTRGISKKEEIVNAFNQFDNLSTFVLSFSLLSNSLPQFRTYADDGRGCALGFDVQRLAQIAMGPQRAYLGTVHYGIAAAADFFNDLFERFGKIHREVDFSRLGGKFHRAYFTQFFLRFYLSYPLFKDPSFSYEREFRLITQPRKDSKIADSIDVVVRRNRVVPFCEIDFSYVPEIVSSIVMGPNAGSDSNLWAMQIFLAKEGFSTATVSKVEAPYIAY